jgi:hypothetical protein
MGAYPNMLAVAGFEEPAAKRSDRACLKTPRLARFATRGRSQESANIMLCNTLAWCIVIYDHISSMELRFRDATAA